MLSVLKEFVTKNGSQHLVVYILPPDESIKAPKSVASGTLLAVCYRLSDDERM